MPGTSGGSSLHSKTILLVNRSCRFRYELCEALVSCGYTVIQAECAREAVTYAEEHTSIRLALISLDLPDVNGMELADILQECRGAFLGVLFISAPDVPEMALMRKTADIREVVEAVRNYFGTTTDTSEFGRGGIA